MFQICLSFNFSDNFSYFCLTLTSRFFNANTLKKQSNLYSEIISCIFPLPVLEEYFLNFPMDISLYFPMREIFICIITWFREPLMIILLKKEIYQRPSLYSYGISPKYQIYLQACGPSSKTLPVIRCNYMSYQSKCGILSDNFASILPQTYIHSFPLTFSDLLLLFLPRNSL